jgi:hypothetical protein
MEYWVGITPEKVLFPVPERLTQMQTRADRETCESKIQSARKETMVRSTNPDRSLEGLSEAQSLRAEPL